MKNFCKSSRLFLVAIYKKFVKVTKNIHLGEGFFFRSRSSYFWLNDKINASQTGNDFKTPWKHQNNFLKKKGNSFALIFSFNPNLNVHDHDHVQPKVGRSRSNHDRITIKKTMNDRDQITIKSNDQRSNHVQKKNMDDRDQIARSLWRPAKKKLLAHKTINYYVTSI